MKNHTTTAAPAARPAASKAGFSGFSSYPDEALVEVGIVAELLGCSRNTVWRRSRAGILPAPVKTGPRSTRWNVGAIRRYLASLTEDAR